MRSLFDLDYEPISDSEFIRPLWTLGEKLDDAEAMLGWQNKMYELELKRIARYREMCMRHLALYKGKYYPDQTGSRGGFAEASMQGMGFQPTRVSKLVINYLYDLVNQRVSRITRNKPSVTINPANSEYSDRLSARVMKYWTDYEFYENDFDALITDTALATYIMGEAYIGVFWNPEKGGVSPDWQEEAFAAEREGRQPRLPVLDSKGRPVMGQDGKQLYIEKPIMTGDLELKALNPLNTIIQFTGDYRTAEYVVLECYEDVDEIKAKYPDQAALIEADVQEQDSLSNWRNVTGISSGPSLNKCLVRYFYQKPTPFLASGRFVVSTTKAILKNDPLPSRIKSLPIVRLTDIDVPGEQRGLSFFTQGKNLNAFINDLTSMTRRNAILMAHPRWVVPRGSLIKKDALGNDITVIEYQGPTPPRIEAPPPMSQELSAIRQELKNELQSILGSFDVSRGDIPANLRSASAIQLALEQEDQRANSGVAKHAALVRDVVQHMIEIASAYYDKDDKRLLPIVGRDNRYLLKEVDPAHFTKSFDVRVTANNGLPNSPTLKADMLIQLKQQFPNIATDEQVADMLQLNNTDKFYDIATVALKAAEAENEAILNGEEIGDPEPFEQLIVHWNAHMQEVQNRGFKTATPQDVQAKLINHIMATEMLMIRAAHKNASYGIELVKLPQFPVFYDLSFEDMAVLDAARTGNPLPLTMIKMLDETGQLPPTMGLAGAPPPGGMGTQAPTPQLNSPMYGAVTDQSVQPGASPLANPQPQPGPGPGKGAGLQ